MNRGHGRQPWRHVIAVPGAVFLAGCAGVQSVLDPASDQAERLAWLGWGMFAGAAIVLLLVAGLLFWGLWRGRDRPLNETQSRRLVVAGGVLLPVALLTPLLVASVRTGAGVSTAPRAAIRIEVTGWQWWWEFRYLDEAGRPVATTANEMHVPAGRPVRLRLIGGDVIHSFWVPKLHGKADLIPGFPNSAWLQAEAPGVFRGQCAEYCGLQHAHMGFLVIAQPPAEFERWLARAAGPAVSPPDETAARGREVFLAAGCGECHTIRGTRADGELGPDLTHVASRRTLAAATLPNTQGHMAGWVADPQPIKPGAFMPALALPPDDLLSLVHYLESLE